MPVKVTIAKLWRMTLPLNSIGILWPKYMMRYLAVLCSTIPYNGCRHPWDTALSHLRQA